MYVQVFFPNHFGFYELFDAIEMTGSWDLLAIGRKRDTVALLAPKRCHQRREEAACTVLGVDSWKLLNLAKKRLRNGGYIAVFRLYAKLGISWPQLLFKPTERQRLKYISKRLNVKTRLLTFNLKHSDVKIET